MKKKEVVHEIFDVCSAVIEDDFWKEKLVDAAYGKFPENFRYITPFLIHKKGKNPAKIEITEDPDEVINAFVGFLTNKGGIFSPNDYQNKNVDNGMNNIDGDEQNATQQVTIDSVTETSFHGMKKKHVKLVLDNHFKEFDSSNHTKEQLASYKSKVGYAAYFEDPCVIIEQGLITSMKNVIRLDNGFYSYIGNTGVTGDEVIEVNETPQSYDKKDMFKCVTKWKKFWKNYMKIKGEETKKCDRLVSKRSNNTETDKEEDEEDSSNPTKEKKKKKKEEKDDDDYDIDECERELNNTLDDDDIDGDGTLGALATATLEEDENDFDDK